MPQNNLEYTLFVETQRWGPIGMLLREEGRELEFIRVGDGSLYKLVGEEPPPQVKIGDEAVIRHIKPDWKIPLHGELQSISDVYEQYLFQGDRLKELIESLGLGNNPEDIEKSIENMKYDPKHIEFVKAMKASYDEMEAVRQGIIRAGVLDGTFPEDYGLPK
ncbi:MAG: hypothetical protein IIC69_03080 [Nanoarchaeota archaeon]|nr:hypothetical protein [Nanoarchaeota archaeon]